MTWNPYFTLKENNHNQQNQPKHSIDDEFSNLYSNPILQQKQLKQQLPTSLTTLEKLAHKYKKNTHKQNSCIPFQINVPQQTQNTKTLTKVPHLGLKPVFGKLRANTQQLQEANTPKDLNLQGSAVWERADPVPQNKKEETSKPSKDLTFEQFLKEQNKSRNNSIDQKQTHYKKNSRQYSHAVQVNDNRFYLQNTTNTSIHNTSASQYSTCDKQINSKNISIHSNREEQKQELTFKKPIQIQDVQTLLSDRTVKKSPSEEQKYKKNMRCISMDQQPRKNIKQIDILLQCDENVTVEVHTPVKFDTQIGGFSTETLQTLMLIELEYAPEAQYLNKQTSLNWLMRAILFDWMMEVSSEFHIKRETYYLSVHYVDSYLSAQCIPKTELQLLGVTCMFIASKMEEIYPCKLTDFTKSADYGYTQEQILEMELKVFKVLKWHLNPPTINLWVNFYIGQWDLFIDDDSKKFKCPGETSYQLYRQLFQLIDCANLDITTLQYKPRTIVASFMYLVLSLAYEQFSVDQILTEIPHGSKYLCIDSQNNFNKTYSDFLQFSFGFNLVDLLPTIQYAATYFILELTYTLPPGLENSHVNDHYEDFLSYQTHNHNQLNVIKRRQGLC